MNTVEKANEIENLKSWILLKFFYMKQLGLWEWVISLEG